MSKLFNEYLMCSKCHEEEVKCSRNVRNQCHPVLVGATWVNRVSIGSILGHTWVTSGSREGPGSCLWVKWVTWVMWATGQVKTVFESIWGNQNFGPESGASSLNNGCLGL